MLEATFIVQCTDLVQLRYKASEAKTSFYGDALLWSGECTAERGQQGPPEMTARRMPVHWIDCLHDWKQQLSTQDLNNPCNNPNDFLENVNILNKNPNSAGRP